ncbi:unnamed protein product [Bursaphelenchus xylophilus]|uniref:(pine wood nematode) hypothetical protein n=1 Tax=Bursaphelenchus xylophilus TaxID=6326 RepID=A0A1I7SEZ5_BURXY|nr:unnamed protein product [Bursaphelenchus xylophilus]CAG9088751.1 unnamed protein product [Bursaphelenchus xylophilus]
MVPFGFVFIPRFFQGFVACTGCYYRRMGNSPRVWHFCGLDFSLSSTGPDLHMPVSYAKVNGVGRRCTTSDGSLEILRPSIDQDQHPAEEAPQQLPEWNSEQF